MAGHLLNTIILLVRKIAAQAAFGGMRCHIELAGRKVASQGVMRKIESRRLNILWQRPQADNLGGVYGRSLIGCRWHG